ncbi:MAG: ABC transporter permease [Caulobacteraceae bacterium]
MSLRESLSRALLVAGRDYRQVSSTRAFRLTLFIVPLAIAISVGAMRLIIPSGPANFVMVDASGRFGGAIERRLEIDHAREVMTALADYERKWMKGAPAIEGPQSDEAVDAFIAGGGAPATLAQIRGRLAPDAPAFKAPDADWRRLALPSGVPADKGPDAFGRAIAPWLTGTVKARRAVRPALAIWIPADFGKSADPVRIWTSGLRGEGLIAVIRSELTSALRIDALSQSGLAPSASAAISRLSAPVAVIPPPSGKGSQGMMIRSAVPIALVYVLLIASMTCGSMMLQGVIEERSDRLIESVLACISPEELMGGKLIGLGGIGLTIMAVWGGCALAGAFAAHGEVRQVALTSLKAIDQPWMILALVYYFLCGYLILAMAFLAVGSMSDSMQDATGYLSPMVLVIVVPVILMMDAALIDPGGALPKVLSWIPLYTPFAMLARLTSGVSAAEVGGTAILLAAFVSLELIALGRLFRASVLSAGQPPNLAGLARRILSGGEAAKG